jgi:two-component system, NtrC family, sensor kinase
MVMKSFKGLLSLVIVTAIALIVLTIATVHLVDRSVIEDAAAEDRHQAFLLAATAVSRIISQSGDIHDVNALEAAVHDVLTLRPGLRRLSVFDARQDNGALIWSSDSEGAPKSLTPHELTEVRAGRLASYFDTSSSDRVWVIAAPITMNGQIIGALRGHFSVAKFDRIAEQEQAQAGLIAIAMVAVTCLAFFILIQRQVHRPIHRLLAAMHRAEAGDLTGRVSLIGPRDLQEVLRQFNRMLDRVRTAMDDKEKLLEEIRDFNGTLTTRIGEAKQELQQTHAMLVEARIQAERNEKLAALGELSAVMAHELGNPLNSISGHLQLALKEAPQQEHHRHLTIIRSEIDRMVAIIQHILESTRLHVQSAPVDLNKIIRDIQTLIAPGLSGKRIVFKTDLTEPLPSVAGDQRSLHAMIFNLVMNAVQAMPHGGELAVKTLQAIDDGVDGSVVLRGDAALKKGAVRLILRDTGHGIPSDRLTKIFEPFFTTRQKTGGTGLGLAICHRVVSSIGGRIAVRSAVNQGTSFTVDLPIWNDPRSGELRHEL